MIMTVLMVVAMTLVLFLDIFIMFLRLFDI